MAKRARLIWVVIGALGAAAAGGGYWYITAEARRYHFELGREAKQAVQAGDLARAEASARELLEMASTRSRDWNYGNALHHAHLVLGRVALGRGDVAGARRHLLQAGRTPGSPQLNSFGPSMALARELLRKGARKPVLEYLELCGSFWEPGKEKLARWKGAVASGAVPDFGANTLF